MLKFLAIFFAIIYLGGMVVKWFLRKWVTNLAQRNQPNQDPIKKEGEVTINVDGKNAKSRNTGEGEYVDYEEVK